MHSITGFAHKLRHTRSVLIPEYYDEQSQRIIESQIGLETAIRSKSGATRSAFKLQVPLFIRGLDIQGQQFMELAKALNISSLGALITCPRAPPVSTVWSPSRCQPPRLLPLPLRPPGCPRYRHALSASTKLAMFMWWASSSSSPSADHARPRFSPIYPIRWVNRVESPCTSECARLPIRRTLDFAAPKTL